MLRIAFLSVLAFFMASPALAAHIFGFQGNNGQNGRNGRQGSDARDVVIFATDEFQSRSTVGTNGASGENGQYGQNAGSCFQPQNAQNERGANGGSGGSGGNGGDGGDAGNMTIYYNDIQNIRNIRLMAEPGIGGRAGRSEWGGSACRCTRYQWEIDEVTYSCQDGAEGQRGQQGRRGQDGNQGRLSVIQNDGPLDPESTTIRLTMSDALNREVAMSEHQWQSKSGARQLFANGSDVPDAYRFYLETYGNNIVTNWNFGRDAAAFAEVPLTYSLRNKAFKMTSGNNIWLESTIVPEGNQINISIDHAIFVNEVTAFNFRGFGGTNGGLTGFFTDDGGAQEYLNTKVYVRYFTRTVIRRLRWEGWVPAELLEVEGNQFKVRLGQLGIDPAFLENGDRIYVEYVVRRFTASNQLDLNYWYNHRIGS